MKHIECWKVMAKWNTEEFTVFFIFHMSGNSQRYLYKLFLHLMLDALENFPQKVMECNAWPFPDFWLFFFPVMCADCLESSPERTRVEERRPYLDEISKQSFATNVAHLPHYSFTGHHVVHRVASSLHKSTKKNFRSSALWGPCFVGSGGSVIFGRPFLVIDVPLCQWFLSCSHPFLKIYCLLSDSHNC